MDKLYLISSPTLLDELPSHLRADLEFLEFRQAIEIVSFGDVQSAIERTATPFERESGWLSLLRAWPVRADRETLLSDSEDGRHFCGMPDKVYGTLTGFIQDYYIRRYATELYASAKRCAGPSS